MFGNWFYNKILEKITVSFGNLFNKIEVKHFNKDNVLIGTIKVPIIYGPRDKLLMRVLDNPDIYKNNTNKLPQMSFEITSVEYNSARKLNTIKINKSKQHLKDLPYQYNGVPYIVKYKLSILSKLVDDANQIIEQILPYFTPSFTVTINTIPELEIKDDITITLNSITMSDNYADDFNTRRDITWELDFSCDCYFYGAVKTKPAITHTIADIHTGVARDYRIDNIAIEDEFGYLDDNVVTITEFDDGKIRDNNLLKDVDIVQKVNTELNTKASIVSGVIAK